MTAGTRAAELAGRCIAVTDAGATAVEMTVTLQYDLARPFEVELTFGTATTAGAGVMWNVCRDLLVDGTTGSAGELDILVNTYALCGDDVTVITLQPPRVEPAHILLSTFSLSEFLAETEEVVPPGTESAIIQTDPLGAMAWELNGGEQGSGGRSDGVGPEGRGGQDRGTARSD